MAKRVRFSSTARHDAVALPCYVPNYTEDGLTQGNELAVKVLELRDWGVVAALTSLLGDLHLDQTCLPDQNVPPLTAGHHLDIA